MKIFVTGGTGFIGSYVVNELVNKGHKLTILARNPEKVSGFLNHDSIDLIRGTIYDNDIIEQGLEDKEACIHIALGWGDNALQMLEKDTKPSIFIMETAAKMGVEKFIYTSSTAAVGDMQPSMDEDISTRPIDFYGATKAASESYLLAIAQRCNMQSNIIRPGYTFGNPVVEGSYMQPDKRFYEIVLKAKSNQNIELIKNDGTQFIWAGDLAKIYSSLISSDFNRNIFFGLSKEFITWETIAKIAIEYSDSSSEIILEDKNWGWATYRFDVSKIEEKFNYSFDCLDRINEHIRYLLSLEGEYNA